MKWFWSGGPDNRKDESASKFPCPIYLQLLSVASLVSAHSFASFPQCEHDFQPGNCSGKVERYTYDKTSRKCVLKEFSSCPGNDNHFWWKTDCQDRCETDEEFPFNCSEPLRAGTCSQDARRVYYNREYDTCFWFTCVWFTYTYLRL
ncbi:Uncharacterised protein r2_g1502 [Pycnogonum litorale]